MFTCLFALLFEIVHTNNVSETFPAMGSPRKSRATSVYVSTGYGRFHYLLLAVCGLVSTSEEMDVISMSFILPSAQCDLDLTTYTKVSVLYVTVTLHYVYGSFVRIAIAVTE